MNYVTKSDLEAFKAFMDDYPLVFCHKHAFPTCGVGWLKLLRETFDKIYPLMTSEADLCHACHQKKDEHRTEHNQCVDFINSVIPQVTQIKEKWACLRIYTESKDQRIREILDAAEAKSATICECCGDPGDLTTEGWEQTLCELCLKIKILDFDSWKIEVLID